MTEQFTRVADAIRAFRLKLWDEDAGRLVPFPKQSAHSMAATG